MNTFILFSFVKVHEYFLNFIIYRTIEYIRVYYNDPTNVYCEKHSNMYSILLFEFICRLTIMKFYIYFNKLVRCNTNLLKYI